ncbi:hypothetical protein ATO13_18360 [Stappia sp. 22II-S9-Z10]|nr:hypothetical protein ATO13_18360 [Stappia sp. 22II-S9-Z10]
MRYSAPDVEAVKCGGVVGRRRVGAALLAVVVLLPLGPFALLGLCALLSKREWTTFWCAFKDGRTFIGELPSTHYDRLVDAVNSYHVSRQDAAEWLPVSRLGHAVPRPRGDAALERGWKRARTVPVDVAAPEHAVATASAARRSKPAGRRKAAAAGAGGGASGAAPAGVREAPAASAPAASVPAVAPPVPSVAIGPPSLPETPRAMARTISPAPPRFGWTRRRDHMAGPAAGPNGGEVAADDENAAAAAPTAAGTRAERKARTAAPGEVSSADGRAERASADSRIAPGERHYVAVPRLCEAVTVAWSPANDPDPVDDGRFDGACGAVDGAPVRLPLADVPTAYELRNPGADTAALARSASR